MEYKDIILEHVGNVAKITLNRPDKLNALSGEMYIELERAFEEIRALDAKTVVITGAGRGFCSGADVTNMARRHESGAAVRRTITPEDLRRIPFGTAYMIHSFERPVIAAINGVSTGAGLGLALSCDIRIAAESARFASIFIKRALAPDFGVSYFLPRAVGMSNALEMMFTGKLINSRDAEKIGLVNNVFPDDALMENAMGLAQEIANGPSIAMEATKKDAYHNINTDLRSALYFENDMQSIARETEDHREGVKAFLEKRQPVFNGR